MSIGNERRPYIKVSVFEAALYWALYWNDPSPPTTEKMDQMQLFYDSLTIKFFNLGGPD